MEWIDIPGYEKYQISDFGAVRSKPTVRTNRYRIRKLRKEGRRQKYHRIILSKNGKQKTFLVHRLVYCSFNNMPLDTEYLILHKNDVGLDNRLCNLKHGTQLDNIKDAKRNNRYRISEGEKNGSSKITADMVLEIRLLYSTGKYTHKQLANKFNLKSTTSVGNIINRKLWKHI